MNTKTGTIRVHCKGGTTLYGTVEMLVGNMVTLKLDDGNTHNFNTDTLEVVTDGSVEPWASLDARDRSWLDEQE